ncbi:MAG TPA: KR domain-containing protein, partial [Ruminiclostridium sp.]|nr:KR domain-containing protein [Ruminiclostridium sp.]
SFDRQRYWIEPSKRNLFGENQDDDSLVKNPNISEWYYTPSWRQSVLTGFDTVSLEENCFNWLIFVNNGSSSKMVLSELEKYNQNIVIVKNGQYFEKQNEGCYTINYLKAGDYEALMYELREAGKVPQKVVHMWSVDEESITEMTDLKHFDYCQGMGFYSVLFFVKALGKNNITSPLHIDIVTDHLYKIGTEEELHVGKSTLLGISRVIPQEYLNITCRCIDILVPEKGSKYEERFAEHLVREFASTPTDFVVGYRANQRWVLTYDKIRYSFEKNTDVPVRENGTYLMIDGLEGLGYAFTEYFARVFKARLLFVELVPFPERSEWESWLQSHENDEVSSKIIKIKEMEDLGAETMLVSVDPSNEKDMREIIEQAVQSFGQLNGVVHAPATIGPRWLSPVQEIEPTLCEQNFNYKARAIYVLENYLEGLKLDFCMVLASLGSILGGLGFAAYSSGNNFMEAFVRRHNNTSNMRWTIMNWDFWENEWRQIEMVIGQGTALGIAASKLNVIQMAISEDEGEKALIGVLSMKGVNHVVISTANLQKRMDRWIKLSPVRAKEESENSEELNLHPRPDLPNSYVAPTTDIEQQVAKVWGEMIGIDKVGIFDDFFDLGGHSLLASKIVSVMREVFNLEIPLRAIFEAPTVEKMAKVIVELKDGISETVKS